jgi:hypothetical protein
LEPLGRIGSSWAGSGLGGIHVQQVQQSGLQRWGLRDDGWVVAAGRDEPQAGQGLEDQPPGGLGRLADVEVLEGEVGAMARRTSRSTRQKMSRARQITVTSASMRQLD